MKAKIKLPKSGYFTVYEDKWVNGNNQNILGCSSLRNRNCNSCCVGHFLRDCGVPIDALMNHFTIDEFLIKISSTKLISWKDKCRELVKIDSLNYPINIYEANDHMFCNNKVITLSRRKKMLRELFMKQFGLKIVFRKHSPETKK